MSGALSSYNTGFKVPSWSIRRWPASPILCALTNFATAQEICELARFLHEISTFQRSQAPPAAHSRLLYFVHSYHRLFALYLFTLTALCAALATDYIGCHKQVLGKQAILVHTRMYTTSPGMHEMSARSFIRLR